MLQPLYQPLLRQDVAAVRSSHYYLAGRRAALMLTNRETLNPRTGGLSFSLLHAVKRCSQNVSYV
jgi:hypothetical protein